MFSGGFTRKIFGDPVHLVKFVHKNSSIFSLNRSKGLRTQVGRCTHTSVCVARAPDESRDIYHLILSVMRVFKSMGHYTLIRQRLLWL